MNVNQMGGKRFKIAYGTYGMPKEDPKIALLRLAEIGYEGIEICVGEAYLTAPQKLSKTDRRELRSLLANLNLELPALMLISQVLTDDPQEYQQQLEVCRAAAELATDLAVGDAIPALATTLGGRTMTWEEDRAKLVERISEVGETVADVGARLAVEPHVGSILAEPKRAVWLVEQVASPAVRLNFDISHFAVAGYPLEGTVLDLAPLAIHTHVKDGCMVDGKVQWLLPGEGNFDYVAYFQAMAQANWRGCITVEISGMIFNKPDHAPWPAAEFSWQTLSTARGQAQL